MVMLIGPVGAFLPLPFVGSGFLSHHHLQYAATAHAEMWAAYNDCTTLYFAYCKLCYLLSTLQRFIECLPGSSA
ncbi:hypothetical protein TSOC_005228 [Tetrabaena socialis]|uniref:Uncharacterized protein n=1 Tax=Tetrabaena socialis TaxID=47790 RepID=A0A2J8A6V0_9CHLO|nr:hypothetical protein TSOC_005228 [Tetrabaena socialis]|eukprot:PNH08227.1 hypothetical protein TSOC_005228 [Tetrabaena socialis]